MDVRYTVASDRTVHTVSVPAEASVGQFLEAAARQQGRDDIRYVFLEDGQLPPDDAIRDWIEEDTVFRVTSTLAPMDEGPLPPVDLAPPPPAPAPPPPVDASRPADALPQGTVVITRSNLVGLPANYSERIRAIREGRIRVYTTTSYQLMLNGDQLRVDFQRSTRDAVTNEIRAHFRIPPDRDIHLFFSTGVRFTELYNDQPNTPSCLFGEVPDLKFKIYAVVTRHIDQALLAREVPEVCSCATQEMRQLLSPVWETAGNVGYSRLACLLGYLRYGGSKTRALISALAAVTDFAPLVCACARVAQGQAVDGLTIATITASLLCLTEHMAPDGVTRPSVAEYVLLAACWLVHIDYPENPPDGWPDPLDAIVPGPLVDFAQATHQPEPLIIYLPDRGEYRSLELRKPPADRFLSLYNDYVSFRPTPPLSIRLMSGVLFVQHTNDVTILKLSENRRLPVGPENYVLIIDPRTPGKKSIKIEDLAKVAHRRYGTFDRAIDDRDIDELVFICVDLSGSMAQTLEGKSAVARKTVADPHGGPRQPVLGDTQRLHYAWQYCVAFGGRLFAYRIPCLIAVLGFNRRIPFQTEFSPLFDDLAIIRGLKPSGETHLWDAIEVARTQLMEKKTTGRFARANFRIVVFCDGEDRGSVATPENLAEQLKAGGIVLDSVTISLAAGETIPTLAKLSHSTGGFAFRPASGSLGLKIFEKEPFLSVRKRPDVGARSCPFAAASDVFDAEQECDHAELQTCRQVIRELDTDRYVLARDARDPARLPRDVRILQELRAIHRAAQPHLRVFCHPRMVTQWRVFLKGPDGTPYGRVWWHIFVKFPDLYPDAPPEIRFVVVPYHPNISEHGRVCRHILFDDYNPDVGVLDILQDLTAMLRDPAAELAMAVSVLRRLECRGDPGEFARKAAESAEDANEEFETYLITVRPAPNDEPTYVDDGGDAQRRPEADPEWYRDVVQLALFAPDGEPLVPLGDEDLI